MKYILFGAGKYMKTHVSEAELVHYDHIVDNDPAKHNTCYLGKEIKSAKSLKEEDRNDIFIVIASYGGLYSIERELIDMGFEKGVHFEWYERLRNHFPAHKELYRLNSEKWKCDEASWRKYSDEGLVLERASLVSKIIRWDGVKTVIDLGAGSEPIRDYLPVGIEYYPVDYTNVTDKTIICDFNRKEFIERSADVVILIGVHGYVDNQIWLLDKAVKAVNPSGQLIVSLNYSTGNINFMDFVISHSNEIFCEDYAFRDTEYGIFRFRKR